MCMYIYKLYIHIYKTNNENNIKILNPIITPSSIFFNE